MPDPKMECPHGGYILFDSRTEDVRCGKLGARCHACREDATNRRHMDHEDREWQRVRFQVQRADARAVMATKYLHPNGVSTEAYIDELRCTQKLLKEKKTYEQS